METKIHKGAVNWSEFTQKVINWADRESNDVSFRFSVVLNNDSLFLSSKQSKSPKTYKIKYSKSKYYADREKYNDQDILPILFQLLKEQYKDINWSVIGNGRRKKKYG